MWAVHSWSWRANIGWEGTEVDFNKPEAYCAFVRLSLSTQRLYQREERGWTPLVLSARPRHGRRQRSDSSRVELGWWVDGERGRKELKPWGLHCCSGGDYDWQANSFHSFSFFSSFSLSPPPSLFLYQVHRVVPPGRDALKVPRLVITLASRLLFKYRAFSYDLVDCVVKAEVVVAIARHFLSFFTDVSHDFSLSQKLYAQTRDIWCFRGGAS